MDQQIRVGDLYIAKSPESSSVVESHLMLNGEEGNASDLELHPDVNSEFSDAATLEQRRAYKIELQVDVIWICQKQIDIILYLHSIEKWLLDFT